MKQFFLDLIMDNSKSSGRFLNVAGGCSIILVFIADFMYNGRIDIPAMGILAAYASGNYGIKHFSSKDKL